MEEPKFKMVLVPFHREPKIGDVCWDNEQKRYVYVDNGKDIDKAIFFSRIPQHVILVSNEEIKIEDKFEWNKKIWTCNEISNNKLIDYSHTQSSFEEKQCKKIIASNIIIENLPTFHPSNLKAWIDSGYPESVCIKTKTRTSDGSLIANETIAEVYAVNNPDVPDAYEYKLEALGGANRISVPKISDKNEIMFKTNELMQYCLVWDVKKANYQYTGTRWDNEDLGDIGFIVISRHKTKEEAKAAYENTKTEKRGCFNCGNAVSPEEKLKDICFECTNPDIEPFSKWIPVLKINKKATSEEVCDIVLSKIGVKSNREPIEQKTESYGLTTDEVINTPEKRKQQIHDALEQSPQKNENAENADRKQKEMIISAEKLYSALQGVDINICFRVAGVIDGMLKEQKQQILEALENHIKEHNLDWHTQQPETSFEQFKKSLENK